MKEEEVEFALEKVSREISMQKIFIDGDVGKRAIEVPSVFRLPKGGFHATSFS